MEKQGHLPEGELSGGGGSVSDGERRQNKIEAEQAATSRAATAAKLTDRDKDLLGLLVLARYLTAAQVHRLAFPGKHASVPYRRFLKLSQADGEPAVFKQRFFCPDGGNRGRVWAPAAARVPAACTRDPARPELATDDV